MTSENIPKPMGHEVIYGLNGQYYTFNAVFDVQKKLNEIIKNAHENIDVNTSIDENNIIYHVILYELKRYSDIIQPQNMLDLFSHISELYQLINKKKRVLTENEFNKLDRCFYKNIEKYYKNSLKTPENCCSICSESFSQYSINIVCKCKHNFHKKCVYKWFTKESSLCPICRQDTKI